jgi:hypothetical protein
VDHTDLDYYRARMAAETLAAECASHPLAAECHLRLAEEYSMLIEANGFRTAA